MRKINLSLLLILFSLSTFCQKKDTKTLDAALETLRIAMIAGDKPALLNLASEKLSYGHSNGIIENKEQFAETISSRKSNFINVTFQDQTITFSKGVAIVRHQINATILEEGKSKDIKLKSLYVWEKEKGNWKMLARQTTKL